MAIMTSRGEVGEVLEDLVLLIIVSECNGLPTQTAQFIHALPFSSAHVGRIERGSTSFCLIASTIAHHLIVAPIPPSRKLLQIYKAQTK